MTTYRAAFLLACIVVTLIVLGITGERLASRLAWSGAALLTVLVGCWMVVS